MMRERRGKERVPGGVIASHHDQVWTILALGVKIQETVVKRLGDAGVDLVAVLAQAHEGEAGVGEAAVGVDHHADLRRMLRNRKERGENTMGYDAPLAATARAYARST